MYDPVRNFAKVVVASGYTSAATTINLNSGEGTKLPDPSTEGAFNLVWWDSTNYPDPSDDTNKEIVRCTARSADTLTITRAQENMSATNKNTQGATYLMILSLTKKVMDDLRIGDIYSASIIQSGANNPIPTIFKNTLGTISWVRASMGIYNGTLSNAFTANKTHCLVGLHVAEIGTEFVASFRRIDSSTVSLTVYDPGGSLVDGFNADIRIEVVP